MIETNRGCPFSCSYCDLGSPFYRNVFAYDIKTVMREIDWISLHNIEFVSCCDTNFGMLPRDMDIVRYIAENKRKYGYPKAFSVQNTKNLTERSYEVQKVLSEAGLSKGVNLALQSLNKSTLKSIKRDNISVNFFQELQRRFTIDQVETYTDLILGLPEETYDSFAEGVSTVIENGQHNRIQFNNLCILPNADLGDDGYQKKIRNRYSGVEGY
ncbi:MAG: radical SAM protein [Syntrophales bacterium LBB04]|nr:radical SAM protein [Syntrophales bacterium LBB04]